ncbi:MAG: hypothetical protein R3D65_05840 [Zhengella sp.]|uniref:hypothetical protein n=1 Tax=Zhengella sp. TaxID=2282762 RepID=UPI003529122C
MSTVDAVIGRADFSASAAASASASASASTSAVPDRDDFRPVLPLLNLGAAWLLAIYLFGYPAVILPALLAVPTIFYVLIRLTMGR